ncbi:MAG TPA: hypothetical protein PLW44_08765 [Chitinophagales bacterium]|nr:hypothetical protein [Chitinophagales bacterium]
MDLILAVIFCYQLHRMAHMRGLSAMPFVLNYLGIFILSMLLFATWFVQAYGADALKTDEGIKAALMFEPFVILLEVFLFIYFRKRIQRTVPAAANNNDDDDYNNRPEPPKEKKDLSYFR